MAVGTEDDLARKGLGELLQKFSWALLAKLFVPYEVNASGSVLQFLQLGIQSCRVADDLDVNVGQTALQSSSQFQVQSGRNQMHRFHKQGLNRIPQVPVKTGR